MAQRIDLHKILCGVMSEFTEPAEKHVYFQPPETVKLRYPCLIYRLSGDSPTFADNTRYFGHKRYLITIIDRNPDSQIPDKIAALPYCSFDRFYTADDLNHFTYNLYF